MGHQETHLRIKMKKINLSPGPIYLILSWAGAGGLGKILYLKMLFPSPNPKPKKCLKSSLDKEDWTPLMCYAHWQKPAERVQKHLLLPQGQGGTTLTPFEIETHLSLLYILVQQSKLKMYGATSFKNIKYKTLPYSISNHSIYRFIFSKKKM